jgi:outer membrane protein TolC
MAQAIVASMVNRTFPTAARACLAAALAALLCTGVRAEALAPLTWDQCVQEAAQQNPELRSARASLAAAQARVRAAHAGYFPQLSAGASYVDSSGSLVTDGSVYGGSVSASQNLFAGFRDVASVEQASANERVSQADFASAYAKISRDLKSAYAALTFAQDAVVLTEQIVRRLQENLRLVQLRFEGGRENQGSFLLTKATLAQGQFDNLQARQAIGSAQAQLARVLGRREPAGLRVAGAVPVSAPPPEPPFIDLVETVPDYRRAQAQEEAAQADVRLARVGFYPTLDLTGTVAREGSDWLPDDSRRSVGLTLNIPLFSGGRDYYGTQSALSTLDATTSSKNDTARQVLVSLKQTHAAFVEALERLRVDQSFLEAATMRAEIARAKYASGLMSFEDWDRIENDLIQRQRAELTSRRDRVNAEAAWEQALGTGVITQ